MTSVEYAKSIWYCASDHWDEAETKQILHAVVLGRGTMDCGPKTAWDIYLHLYLWIRWRNWVKCLGGWALSMIVLDETYMQNEKCGPRIKPRK